MWLLRARVAAEWLSLKQRLLGLVVGQMLPSPICTPSVWQGRFGGWIWGSTFVWRAGSSETDSPGLIQLTANWKDEESQLLLIAIPISKSRNLRDARQAAMTG